MKGYTCCIDLHELGKTVEILSSVSDCILNNNLTNIFYDMDNMLKKISFEHGNCFSSFPNTFDYIEKEVDIIGKELFQLNYALQKTIIISRQSDNNTIKELQELSEYYGDGPAKNTGQTLYMNPRIIMADNKDKFEKEIDPFIKVITESPMEEEILPYTINDYNTLPIGISIALTGTTASAGAAMIHSIRETEKNKKTENQLLFRTLDKTLWDDPVPSYAKKDLEDKKELFEDNYDFLD